MIFHPHTHNKHPTPYTPPYLQDEGLHLPTQLSLASLLSGMHEVVGGDAVVGHPLLVTEHPNNDIRDGVLGLEGRLEGMRVVGVGV